MVFIERSYEMKKHLIMTAILIFLVPCLGFSDMITFKVGYFIPRASGGEDSLWFIELHQMDFDESDFYGQNFGFTYEYFLSRELSLSLSVDSYTKKKVGYYEGYVGETIDGLDYAFDYGEGFGISHVFDVSITPIQLSAKLAPMGRTGRFIPYIGGGVGIYLWNVTLQGYIIDFAPGAEEIFYDPNIGEDVIGFPVDSALLREDNRFNIGFHALGGVMFPIANRISIEGEFKYNFLKGDLTEAFEGFEPFDLSGYQLTVGLNYWF
jgi:opacity protein-like surface antigen